MPVEELMRRYYGGGGASPAAVPAAVPAAARPALPAPVAADSELPPGFAPAAVAAFVPVAPVVVARPVPPRLVLPPPPPPLSPRSDALRGARCAAAREREDALIFRARHLRDEASRRASERAVPAAKPDPARNKTHWDHLLEEMAWLARDSDRERKWKRKQARKAATAVKGSRLDIESRAVAREAAEVASLRRIASTCAREVRVFWGKAEKLVRIKANMALEAQRKSAMDKHLEFVMAQTERYCNLVATKLTAAPVPPAGGAGPSQPRRALPMAPADDDDAFEPGDDEGMDDDDEATLDEQMEAEEAEGGGAAAAAAEAAALAAERDAPLEDLLPPELLARYRAGGAATPSDASDEDEEADEADDGDGADVDDADGDAGADAPALRELARSPPPGAAAADANGGAADDDPSSSFEGGSEEDDEATLEEEEAAAAAEGGAEDAREAEMDALKAEADLPLDELLRRMGYNPGGGDDDDDVAEEGEEDGDDGAEASSGEEEEDEEGGGAGDESGGDEGEEAAGRWAHALLASPPAKGGGAAGGDDDEEAEAGRRGLEEFAASAGVAQPTGHTLATTAVSTTVPFLMKAQLREYQHVGLDWLVALYEKQLNGILADEMVCARIHSLIHPQSSPHSLTLCASASNLLLRAWARRSRRSACWRTWRASAASGART